MPKEFVEMKISVPYGSIMAKAWGHPTHHSHQVLALHGWQDNAGTFDKLIPLLPDSVYVLAVDLPGHGLSSHLPPGCPYHDLVFLMEVKRVIDHMNWDKFTILGHSMGAAIGMFYACLYPQSVVKVIAIDMIKPLSFPAEELAKRTCDGINTFLALEQKIANPPVYDHKTTVQKMIAAHAIYGTLSEEAAECLLKRGAKMSSDGKGEYFTRDNRIKAVLFQRMDSEALRKYLESIECELIIIKAKNGIELDPQEINDKFMELYRKKCKTFKLIEYIIVESNQMFKNTFQSGFLSVLYSIGSNPLQIWDKKVKNGSIKRITDNEIQSLVIEISGANVSTTFITCPSQPRASLGIKLPFLVIIVKNMKKYFSFEVEIIDDKQIRRRFRASNYQSQTRVKHFICTMPLRLDEGWNQIGFNLADFTRRAYGTNYVETQRLTINANCRLRRVYFADRLYSEDELPPEFKLYLPITAKT
ncbi:unnamed protein product [Medioppia subpectinata]|uniref:CFA20 domain-containing protein n=1 Tax=Medioppia subpectinata TaxID=1979941 RepID=A0A7R9KKU4_9ACAR|nr:unnamed protein product [Medioppia subpectinata]CAG2105490.1 unnamed protein product [Medioppia subpectinata]